MRVLIYEKNEKEAEKFESYISNKVRETEFYKCYNVKDALYFTMMTDIDLFVVNACSETEDRYTPKGIEFIEFIRKHEKTKFTPVIVTSKLYDENEILKELLTDMAVFYFLRLKEDIESGNVTKAVDKALMDVRIQLSSCSPEGEYNETWNKNNKHDWIPNLQQAVI